MEAATGQSLDLTAVTSDADGDNVTITWEIDALSNPSIDCTGDFNLADVHASPLTITMPADPPTAGCGGDVQVVLHASDGQSETTATLVVMHLAQPALQIIPESAVIELPAGTTVTATADATPGSTSKTYTWNVTDAGCGTSGLTIGSGTDSAAVSSRPLSSTSANCSFGVQITADDGTHSATANLRVDVVNTAPTVSLDGYSASSAGLGPATYNVIIPPDVQLPVTLTSRACDVDNQPLTQTWGGTDAASVTCPTANCTSASTTPTNGCTTYTVQFFPSVALTAGASFSFTVSAQDSAGASGAILVNVAVQTCLWVRAGGTGAGSIGFPYGSIQPALDAAKAMPNTNVCIVDDTYKENLTIPSTPNSPNLLGGFLSGGVLNGGTGALIESDDTTTTTTGTVSHGAQFEAGYSGTVHGLSFTHASSLSVTGQSVAVTVTDASPHFSNVSITGGGGDPAVGLLIDAEDGTQSTAPHLADSIVQGSDGGNSTDVIGVWVQNNGGTNSFPTLGGGDSIYAGAGSGTGTAIRYDAGTSALIRDNVAIDVCGPSGPCSFMSGYGIDLRGTASATDTGNILNNIQIGIGGYVVSTSAVIRVANTYRLTVDGNGQIGTRYEGGADAAFGIADGWLDPGGISASGNSTLLHITNNGAIAGGGQTGPFCPSDASWTRPGSLSAGVLLVGTGGSSLVQNNGWGAGPDAGVTGGVAMAYWNDGTERLPPSAVGIWTVSTTGVTVKNNLVRSGTIGHLAGCDWTGTEPAAVAFRDGLPPTQVAVDDSASAGLAVLGNSCVCGLPAPSSGGTEPQARCIAAEIDAAQGVSLENNILGTVSADENTGLWIHSGAGVRAVHNTIIMRFVPGSTPPAAGSVEKWAVRADNLVAGGLILANNIIELGANPPADDPTERLALWETNPNGAGSHIDVLSTNIVYLDGDDLSTDSLPAYLRLDDASARSSFAAADLNSYPAATTLGNQVIDPQLTPTANNEQDARLTAGSPAIDACDASDPSRTIALDTTNGIPVASGGTPIDIDGDTRPQGSTCDIGADEFAP